MPIYEYQCADCGHRGEELQKMGARPLKKCPQCGGKYEKQISAPSFQFKGSGWYVTDYAKAGADKGAKADDAGKGEAKSDAKTEAAADSTSGESKSKPPTKKETKDGGAKKNSDGGSSKASAS
jgi:putative FmdB family regulatory protein